MKFFITGTIRSEKGPRAILSFTLLFFVVFLIMNAALLYAQTGLLPERIVEMHEPSTVMRLERTHVQLFLFTMVYVITGSIFFQTRLASRLKHFGLVFGAMLTFLYLLSYPLLVTTDAGLVLLYAGSAVGVHIWYGLLVAFLLYDLFAPHAPHATHGQPPSPTPRRPNDQIAPRASQPLSEGH